MGLNIMTCCHKHKVKVFHFRGEEDRTVMPFYYKHADCMGENRDNVETKDDQYQEEDWMYEYDDDIEVKQRGCDHFRVRDGVCALCDKVVSKPSGAAFRWDVDKETSNENANTGKMGKP